jgi:hypothetical protein
MLAVSHMKSLVSGISRKRQQDLPAPQTPEEVTLEAAAALIKYRPERYPSVVQWLESPKASASCLVGPENTDIEEVPQQGPRRQSEEEFRRSWNGFVRKPEIAEAATDDRFDQLRTTYPLDETESPNRNDSGLVLVDDSMQPDVALNREVETTDIDEAELLAMTAQWQTRIGRLGDLIEEHAASCRKCRHESCWE